MYSHVFACILMYSHVFACIRTYSHVFACIRTYSTKWRRGTTQYLIHAKKRAIANTRIHDDTGKSAPHPIAKLKRDHVDSSAPGGRSAPHVNECSHSVVL